MTFSLFFIFFSIKNRIKDFFTTDKVPTIIYDKNVNKNIKTGFYVKNFLEFDIHTSRNERGIKLNVDITYGDSMASEFSIESPNKINVIHYTGINSKYDPKTYFGFTDETINDLVNLFNSFNQDFKLTSDDFKFIDKDPDSYKHDINNSDHLYNDDSDLISFGNSMKESISNDIILVINNSKSLSISNF